ncbi:MULTISPECIES: hypothetical protein [Streptomyces]|uniref:Restriction endonuclease domain-containing protein n=1 Tax=Streptomyces lienomycini TaxID=284035 RepID=A0ABV9WSU4_9ACTN|nr:hypothetical protein [Streptomyces lienomycini]
MVLTTIADEIMERHPGYRVEIIRGQLLVSPLRDGHHSCTLTTLTIRFVRTGLHDDIVNVLQGVGLWLPLEAEDYATHRVHSPGETVTLPDSLGAEVTLDVAEILAAGRPKSAPGEG